MDETQQDQVQVVAKSSRRAARWATCGGVIQKCWRSICPGEIDVPDEKTNVQEVGRDFSELKPQEGVKRTFLPLRLSHLLSITGQG